MGGGALKRRHGSAGATALCGLLYCDGADAAGAPVVVVDTAYMPHASAARAKAVEYIKQTLKVCV